MTTTTQPGMDYHNPDARNYHAPPTGGDVAAFHATLDGYTPTRLVDVPDLAGELGVARVLVKDESNRLGLPAFKILGASWATFRAVSDRLGLDYRSATVPSLRKALHDSALTLVTATDGNHGRAVAVMARLLGVQARIYTPAGLTRAALDAIRGEGAKLLELDRDYDDVVTFAAHSVVGQSEDLLIQDAAWEGYEDIPGWIVDGYATLFAETDAQLAALGLTPSHVVVPVGVGSLAQAAVAHYRRTSSHRPRLVSVEPVTADCVTQSLTAGQLLTVPTAPTVMTGLNCGTPSHNAWPYLAGGLDLAVTVTDEQVIAAVHRLTTAGMDAGPCGAATWAAARTLQEQSVAGLNGDSVVVLISTEGQQANPLGDRK
jgi:diaminopropionate ammonia-lyase